MISDVNEEVTSAGLLAADRMRWVASCRRVLIVEPDVVDPAESERAMNALCRRRREMSSFWFDGAGSRSVQLADAVDIAMLSSPIVLLPGAERSMLYRLLEPLLRSTGAVVFEYPSMRQRSTVYELPNLVLLKGQMCSGKDFIGARLVEEAGFTRFAMADALKQELADKHGISVDELNRRKGEFRAEMQEVGQGRRNEDPRYWIDKLQDHIARNPGRSVVTDIRYTNEGQCMSHGLMVHVQVDESVRQARIKRLYGDVPLERFFHTSEIELMTMSYDVLLPGDLPAHQIVPELARSISVWRACGCPSQKLVLL